MLTEMLLPAASDLDLSDVVVEDEVVILTVSSVRIAATCPDCHQPSSREHSHYWRTVADLACAERQIRLHLYVRRFFCDNPLCERKTFAEQFPDAVVPYGRRTNRLTAKQRRVGLAIGCEPGAETLTEMTVPVSGDTVLRLVRDSVGEDTPTPRVLGIADWAWAKGQRYGTILVDLERHRVIDLLPDRSADILATWLEAHPGIEIVSRDRAREYIKGINQGAPDATQVADRWHLLRNLGDALIRLLDRKRACLFAAAAEPEDDPLPEPAPEVDPTAETTAPSPMSIYVRECTTCLRQN